ncbi:MAG: FAD-dependent monooxygenase [Candidatus Ozemobacteraceae bacterium]
MRISVQQVSVPLEYSMDILLHRVGKKVACDPSFLSNLTVIRRSLDARPRNPEPQYVLTVEVDVNLSNLPPRAHRPSIEFVAAPTPEPARRKIPTQSVEPRPIVVGAGPAGLLAAYLLARAGARPILIERGEDALARAPKVARFWRDGTLDPESNVLFGEGGAGLFSDGKLTARSKERQRGQDLMQLLNDCGADESVLIDAEPHIGSDVLRKIVPNLRERILAAGGEVRFQSRLEALLIQDGRLRAVVVNGQEISCNHCVLAVGHSARDTYDLLVAAGIELTVKPFAVGVRLELSQAAIDHAQYGQFAGSPFLGAASFRLTRREEPGVRACYTFCMCPGGTVIACASEPGLLTTNGMSDSHRTLARGNAAFLVRVGPEDYPESPIPALAGVAFQRDLERKAFTAGGGAYGVPAVRLVDFLAHTISDLPKDCSCSRTEPAEFRTILPGFVTDTLEKSIPAMLKELNGVTLDDAVLYAAETRSSSPVWIVRGPDGQTPGTRGIFPAGEGAGYSGGIVSSAIDGMRAAEQVLDAMTL